MITSDPLNSCYAIDWRNDAEAFPGVDVAEARQWLASGPRITPKQLAYLRSLMERHVLQGDICDCVERNDLGPDDLCPDCSDNCDGCGTECACFELHAERDMLGTTGLIPDPSVLSMRQASDVIGMLASYGEMNLSDDDLLFCIAQIVGITGLTEADFDEFRE